MSPSSGNITPPNRLKTRFGLKRYVAPASISISESPYGPCCVRRAHVRGAAANREGRRQSVGGRPTETLRAGRVRILNLADRRGTDGGVTEEPLRDERAAAAEPASAGLRNRELVRVAGKPRAQCPLELRSPRSFRAVPAASRRNPPARPDRHPWCTNPPRRRSAGRSAPARSRRHPTRSSWNGSAGARANCAREKDAAGRRPPRRRASRSPSLAPTVAPTQNVSPRFAPARAFSLTSMPSTVTPDVLGRVRRPRAPRTCPRHRRWRCTLSPSLAV